MSKGHAGFLKLLDEMRELHLRKAADYGSDSDPLNNLRASAEVGIEPWVGAWLRAKDKVKRIDQFCQKGSLANESVEDSLQDLAAYCLLALVLRRERQAEDKEADWVGGSVNENDLPIAIDYTNHRGDRRWRMVIPRYLWCGEPPHHPGEGRQWFLRAYDVDKKALRDFALKDIHSFHPSGGLEGVVVTEDDGEA